MGMTFTAIPQDTFNELQLNAGVLLKSFDVESPALVDSNIICATTGGLTVTAKPTFSDLGEDIDNCPKNVKELKHLDNWEASMAFTALNLSVDTIKLALGSADSTESKITPRNELKQTDFSDAIWWVGDLSDGKFVAVELKNALSTEGLSLKTVDKGKGQMSVTLTGHYSLAAQNVVPVSFYIGTVTA